MYVRRLVPEQYRIGNVQNTIPGILFCGKQNIHAIVEYWKREMESTANEMRSIREQEQILKNGFDIKDTQVLDEERWNNKTFHQQAPSGFPEPTEEKDKERKAGSTTFNVCGWCKFATKGTCRYEYHINPNCGILLNAGVECEEKPFYAKCVFREADKDFTKSVLAGLSESYLRLGKYATDAEESAIGLFKLELRAKEKPVFPRFREAIHFRIDDKVVVYCGDGSLYRRDGSSFVKGIVISGYRHHDGVVSVRLIDARRGLFSDTTKISVGASRPEVIHVWEYDYLRANPDFLGLWISTVTGCAFDLETFCKKIKEHKDV